MTDESGTSAGTGASWTERSVEALGRLLRDGVVFLGPRGDVDYASRSALTVCGVQNRDELDALFETWRGRIVELVGQGDDPAEPPRVTVERTLDGHTRRIELRVLPIDDGACEGHVVLASDRTARELLEDALQRANSLARRDALLQANVHDLKAPMNAIVLTLDLLQETLQASSDATAFDRRHALEFVEAVRTDMSRLERLLASMAKAPARLGAQDRQRVDLRELVRESIMLFRPNAQARRVNLQPKVPDEEIPVFVHRDQISQALTNVVVNAIEACDGPARVDIVLEHTSGEAVITVADEGSGISEAIRPLLFQPHVTTKPAGSGLGLHVSRQLLIAHGGDITVDSRGSRGTCVTLRLPIAGRER